MWCWRIHTIAVLKFAIDCVIEDGLPDARLELSQLVVAALRAVSTGKNVLELKEKMMKEQVK